MRPVSVREAYPVVICQLEAAARARIRHDFRAWYAAGIELIIPRRIQRIGPVHPLAVTANLDDLGTACILLALSRTAQQAQVRNPAKTSFRSGGKKFRYFGRAIRALVAKQPPRSTLRVPNHGCE